MLLELLLNANLTLSTRAKYGIEFRFIIKTHYGFEHTKRGVSKSHLMRRADLANGARAIGERITITHEQVQSCAHFRHFMPIIDSIRNHVSPQIGNLLLYDCTSFLAWYVPNAARGACISEWCIKMRLSRRKMWIVSLPVRKREFISQVSSC
jgi:hypothetical protein